MIETPGRYLLETGSEARCIARIATSVCVELIRLGGMPAVQPGMKATCYLDSVGVVPGFISEVRPNGFTLLIEANAERRCRIDDRLAWLRAHAGDTADQRSDPRIVPDQRTVSVKVENGKPVIAQIVDLSMSGAALAISERPDPGAVVTVGKRFATVVRHTADGVAIRFRLPFSATTFNERVVL